MNQPPPTDKRTVKQAGKRIVSKGEYVLVQSNKAAEGIVSMFLWLATAGTGFLTLLLLIGFLYFLIKINPFGIIFFGVLGFGSGAGTFFFAKMALELTKDSMKELEIVPLTRASIADLPAPDTLVRASVQPVQEQEAMLLRAATGGVERQEEQLVRPSITPE